MAEKLSAVVPQEVMGSDSNKKAADGLGFYKSLGKFCFIEWGIIHIFACVMIMTSGFSGDLSTVLMGGPAPWKGWKSQMMTMDVMPGKPYHQLQAVYDKLEEDCPAAKAEYEAMRGKWPVYSWKVVSDFGFILGGSGIVSVLSGIYSFSSGKADFRDWAIMAFPLFADIGYWMHFDWFDLGGVMGEMQTYILSIGLLCLAVCISKESPNSPCGFLTYALPTFLFVAAAAVKAAQITGNWPYAEEMKLACEGKLKVGPGVGF